jgi:hypothetical protein
MRTWPPVLVPIIAESSEASNNIARAPFLSAAAISAI